MVQRNIILNIDTRWYRMAHYQEVYKRKTFLEKRKRLLLAMDVSEVMSVSEQFRVYDLDLSDYRYITVNDDLSDKFKYIFAADKFKAFLKSSQEVFIFRDMKYARKGRTVIGYADSLEKAKARQSLRA